MTVSGIALRRLAAQGIAGARCDHPADVVRRLSAVQAQDYGQSLWAIGSRLRRGTVAQVERAIEERQIVRTWLMRGTIHLAPAEDVRWLLDLCAPRLAGAEARRREQVNDAELGEGRLWHGHPVWLIGTTPVSLLKAYTLYVTFGLFQGQSIDDASGRLEPASRQMAAVRFRGVDDIDEPFFAGWLRQANALVQA